MKLASNVIRVTSCDGCHEKADTHAFRKETEEVVWLCGTCSANLVQDTRAHYKRFIATTSN